MKKRESLIKLLSPCLIPHPNPDRILLNLQDLKIM